LTFSDDRPGGVRRHPVAGDGPHGGGSVVVVVDGARVVDVVEVVLDDELLVVDVVVVLVVVVVPALHVAEPGGADVPGGHGVHAVAAPIEYVSAGQTRQADAPSAAA
jgi:hypothetical protein